MSNNNKSSSFNLPPPILRRTHPASASPSPRPCSPSPVGRAEESGGAPEADSDVPSSSRTGSSLAPTSTASVTFSEPITPYEESTSHPAPPHSILRPAASTSGSNSPRNSVDTENAANDETQHDLQLRAALLQLPNTASHGGESASREEEEGGKEGGEEGSKSGASSRNASPAPSSDRMRIVGKGGYGGRKGGPSLTSKRTSSSGGLSDVDMRAGYERKVGFDTMRDAEETASGSFSFTLQVKSIGYLRTKNTRTFMCAVDDNAYSERALEWLMESLVEDGDEVVALRVLEGDAEEIDQDDARDEARELMASVVQLNDEVQDRSISIVVEFVAGRVTNTIIRLIHMYRPDSLIVGTKGKTMSAFQKMLGGASMGSCSRDILNRSPVPVVIVRPEAKVKKHLAKRANDPKRRSYHDLVALQKEESLPLSVGSKSWGRRHRNRKG